MLANVGAEVLVSVEVYPQGEAPGLFFWSASGYLVNFTPTAAVDGAVEVNGARLVMAASGTWAAQP